MPRPLRWLVRFYGPENGDGGLNARGARRVGLTLSSAQLIIMVVIAVYFAIVTNQQNHVLAAQAIAQTKATQSIVREIRQDITIHARATVDRNCASTRLLAFIIETGNRRADKLHTGSYLTPEDQARIHNYVAQACLFQPIP
jgi:hypothetical protein